MAICPAGHNSAADDYCDVCGLPVGPQGVLTAPAIPPVLPLPGALCPHCGTNNAPDALFCEACGYDFTTGTMPRTATPQVSPSPASPPAAWGATPAAPSASPPATWGGAPAASAWETPASPSSDAAPSSPDAAPTVPQGIPVIPADAEIPGQARDDEVGLAQSRPSPDAAAQGAPSPVIPADAGISLPSGEPASPAEPSPAPVVTPPSRRPLQPRPTSVEWVAEVWIDPDWYATQGSSDARPSPALPEVIPLRAGSALIGRTSVSRNIHPDIDCTIDNGVSRRHAQITTDGTRWWIEDLESANGTFVGSSAGPLPRDPIGRGRVEFAPDQRLYLGAWTRIVVRAATEDEVQAFNA